MPYYQEPPSIPTVVEALQHQTVEDLKKLTALLPLANKPTRKAELVTLLRNYLEVEENLRTLWTQLDQLQQAAVAEVVHSLEPRFPADRFQAKYRQLPNWGSSDRYGYNRQPSRLGLFFYSNVMPEGLKQRLKQFVPQPAVAKMKTIDQPPTIFHLRWQQFDFDLRKSMTVVDELPVTLCEMERAAQHDLQAVLRLINTGKVAVSDKTRFPTSATLKAIPSLLQGGDYYDDSEPTEDHPDDQKIGPIKAFAWPMIVQAAGLAELSGKRLQLTKTGQKALSTPSAETLRTAWKKWLKTNLLDELRRVESIKGQTGKGKRGLTTVSGRRSVIVKALAECPVRRWMAVDEFFRYMQATGYDFEVSRNPWDLYISEPGYGSLGYEGFHNWSILQGPYALCLLFEYAATLGLLDVAYIPPHGVRSDYRSNWGTDDLDFFSRYDGLLYFRLTSLGAYCLNISEAYTPPPLEVRPVLRVLANLEVAAIGEPLPPVDVLLLDLYAEKTSDAVWRLDQTKLLTAIEEGHSIAELRELLQARSGQPLPETVNQFLIDVEGRTGSLQDQGTARLIECADPALATLIANDSRTKRLCLPAGERHLVIPAESETRFRSALRKLGYSIPLSRI
jgi:hypothetical protein